MKLPFSWRKKLGEDVLEYPVVTQSSSFIKKSTDAVVSHPIVQKTVGKVSHKHLFGVAGASLVLGFYFTNLEAATHTFTQTSWAGGVTSNFSVHPGDKNGWNQFFSKDVSTSVTNGGQDLTLGIVAASTTITTSADFSSGTHASSTVIGVGAGGSVTLQSVSGVAKPFRVDVPVIDANLTHGLRSPEYDAKYNYLWFASGNYYFGLTRVNPVTNQVSFFDASPTTAAHTYELEIDTDRDEIWTLESSVTRKVNRYTLPNLTYVDTISEVSSNSLNHLMAYDPDTASMFLSAGGLIKKINTNTLASTSFGVAGGNNLQEIRYYAGKIYATFYTSRNLCKVDTVSLATNGCSVDLGSHPMFFAIDTYTNSAWVANQDTEVNNLKKIRLSDMAVIGSYALPFYAESIEFDPNSNSIWMAGPQSGVGKIAKVSVVDGTYKVYNTRSSRPMGLVYEPGNKAMWLGSYLSPETPTFAVSRFRTDEVQSTDYPVVPVTAPDRLAFDPSTGSVWVAGSGGKNFAKVDINTGGVTGSSLAQTGNIGDIAFDTSSNSLWLTESAVPNAGVTKVNPSTISPTVYPLATSSQPYGFFFNGVSGDMYLSLYSSTTGNSVLKFNPNTGNAITTYPVSAMSYQPAFDPVSSTLWFTGRNTNTYKVNMTSGVTSNFVPVLNCGANPCASVYDPTSLSIWSTSVTGGKSVVKINPANNTYTTYPTLDFIPNGSKMTYETLTNSLWVPHSSSSYVVRVNPSNASTSMYLTGNGPSATVLDTISSALWVANKTSNSVTKIPLFEFAYASEGSYISPVTNLGQSSSLTSVSYDVTIPANTALTVDVRAGDTPTVDGSWTAWQVGVVNEGSVTGLGQKKYVQYRVNMSTSISSIAPSLNHITFNYNAFPNESTLISSPYNSSSDANVMSKIEWIKTEPEGTQVKFQVRTAPDQGGNTPGTWSAWVGPDGTGSTYFTSASGGDGMPAMFKDGVGDQWFQYKVYLTTTDRGVAPTLSDVTVTYVVNNPPEFDGTFGTNGVQLAQITDFGDENLGKVHVSYRVRDIDSTTGSMTPGFVNPSFEYNVGGGWVQIPEGYLVASSTGAKAVGELSYTTYETYWDAGAQIPGTFTTSAQVRVRLNDNEGANNIAHGISASFTLDASKPAGIAHINGNDSSVVFSATDNSTIKDVVISNSSDGSNGTTFVATSSSFSFVSPWTFSASSTSVTVYAFVRDIYGNTATTTAVAPVAPDTINIKDVSLNETEQWQEFILWKIYPTIPEGAAFSKYEVYRSTDTVNYTLLTSITNPTVNYYLDSNLTKDVTYSYKVRYVDQDDDTSDFSSVVTDTVDGQGGTDNAPPAISNVTFSHVKSTEAKITWTTDEFSNSRVSFGNSTAYGTEIADQSYVMNHSVVISGLTPNTEYKFKVESTDISLNTGLSDNGGAGYAFTTSGGPVLSDIRVSSTNDTSAEILWSTNIPASSVILYGTDSTMATYTQGGNSEISSDLNHAVTLTGLSSNTRYYFDVKSVDANTYETVADNGGAHYTFMTTDDNIAPEITSVSVPVISQTAAVVTWMTNEYADSQVEYGLTASTTSGMYPNVTQVVSTPALFHSITLSPETVTIGGAPNTLSSGAIYYYRVKSKDKSGNITVSPERSFSTPTDSGNSLVIATVVQTVIASSTGGSDTSSVGQLAGNDSIPPKISDIQVVDITPFGATIKFATDKETRGLVAYGLTADYGQNNADSGSSQNHTITIRGLSMGTTYHYAVTVIDSKGNVASSEDKTLTTTFASENLGMLTRLSNGAEDLTSKLEDIIQSALPSVNPPFISQVTVSAIDETSAKLSWKTNVKAYSTISYATDGDYKKQGAYTVEETQTDEKVTDHSIVLHNLAQGTKHHYSIKAYVFNEAAARTEDAFFSTKASDVDVTIEDKKKDSFRVVWRTDVPTSSVVEYVKDGAKKIERRTDQTLTTRHDVKIENITPKTTYKVKAYGYTEEEDLISAKKEVSVTTGFDSIAPTITNFKVDSALVPGRTDKVQTIVSWKTDEPATSIVYYDAGSGSASDALKSKLEDSSSLSTNHVMLLSSLKPGSIYRIQVASIDDAGNLTRFPVRTVVTPRQTESIVDVIFKNYDDTFKFINN